MSKGYDKACDLWSFGVLTYELLVGKSPFLGPGTRMDMFKRIVQIKYDCPVYVTEPAKDFIQKLLVRRPTDRLGNRAQGHSEAKKHPWFKETNIAFKNIMARTQPPPWKPSAKELLTMTSFDDYSDLEKEDDDDDEPLTEEEQDLFADF
jgi:serine/threonine protein kinase